MISLSHGIKTFPKPQNEQLIYYNVSSVKDLLNLTSCNNSLPPVGIARRKPRDVMAKLNWLKHETGKQFGSGTNPKRDHFKTEKQAFFESKS